MVINKREVKWEIKVRGEVQRSAQRSHLSSQRKGRADKVERKDDEDHTQWSLSPDFRLLSTSLCDVFLKRWHTTGKQKTINGVGGAFSWRDGSASESKLGEEGWKQYSQQMRKEINLKTAKLTKAMRSAKRMTAVVVAVVNHDSAPASDFPENLDQLRNWEKGLCLSIDRRYSSHRHFMVHVLLASLPSEKSYLCALKSVFENCSGCVPAQDVQPSQETMPHFPQPTLLLRELPCVCMCVCIQHDPYPGKADWFRGKHLTQLHQSDSFPEILEFNMKNRSYFLSSCGQNWGLVNSGTGGWVEWGTIESS